MGRCSWVVMAALMCVASGAAFAQPAPGAGEPRAAAAQYVEAGMTAQKNGDFDTAIDLYTKANALLPHPTLLYNLAQAHRLAAARDKATDPKRAAAHRDEARALYRKFLDTAPEGDLEVTARGWLAKLDAQWAEENPKEEAARRAEEARKREDATRAEEERLRREREREAKRDEVERAHIGAAVATTRRDSERRKGRTLEIVGLAAAGAGVLATGAGVYFGLHARTLERQLEQDDVYDVRRIDDGRAANRNMKIAYVAGGALLVGGVVTYLIGHRASDAAGRVAWVPAAGGGTLVFGGGF